MSNPYSKHFSTRETPQNAPIPGSSQVPNSAGGFSFAVSDWTRLDRFLVLGSEQPSYYATAKELTVENAKSILNCLKEDGLRTVSRIVEISQAGRAPKNDSTIFALAMAAGSPDVTTRQAALAALPNVARIGTHLFQFCEAVEKFRGHGRSLNRALQKWYLDKAPRDLAYQLVKYQQREGWSHRDVLRLCKPKAEGLHNVLFRWAVKGLEGWTGLSEVPPVESALHLVWAMERAKVATSNGEVVKLIQDYDLVRECIPTQWLTEAEVWGALLEKMPLTAMIRNLATMTRVGLLSPMSSAVGKVIAELSNVERLRKARVHPISLLVALRTYAAGRGERGKNTWTPVQQVVDALDKAFYLAFDTVVPTGKRWLLALDVSGSMAGSMISGVPNLSARDASAAMALVIAATEPNHHIIGFTGRGFRVNSNPVQMGGWGSYANQGSGVESLGISPRQRLDDAVRVVSNLPMGPTDCALPMLYALEKKLEVDAFVVMTDSETYHGDIRPSQALVKYRERTGIPAKLIIMGMVSNGFSIASPDDAGMMDCVGMDTNVPALIADFVRG